MHPHFSEMLGMLPKADERNYGVVVSTNGMLLDRPMMKALIKAQVNRLHFSLDGTGTKHEERRVGSCYETVKKNILEITKLKHGRRFFPGISVNMVIDGDTLPCCCDLEGRNTLGNIVNSTITAEFENEKVRALRETHMNKTLPDGHICKECDIGKRFLHRYLYNPDSF